MGELLEVARHRQSRTIKRLLRNHVIETLLAGEELHLEHIFERIKELTDGDGFRAGDGSRVVHGVRV